ncbi:MAG: hypothetical protein EA401_10010 [Planctomycetota bacterium]|nr:MAG: hypothetical protein EA401_10010 [Planctomycetota bacterium]
MVQQWDRILQRLGNSGHIPLVAALTACRIIASDETTLGIEVPDHRDCTLLFRDTQQHLDHITATAQNVSGHGITATLIMAPGSRSSGRYREAEEHPSVKKLRRLFSAEILAFEPMSEAEWERYLSSLE